MSLSLTESAANKLRTLLAEENNPAVMLRIFVSGGGCQGFQYGFAFDDRKESEDEVVESRGVNILVDPLSHAYLRDSEVDFVEDLSGAQFVIKNPNAASTCGCGQSFSPKADGSGCSYS